VVLHCEGLGVRVLPGTGSTTLVDEILILQNVRRHKTPGTASNKYSSTTHLNERDCFVERHPSWQHPRLLVYRYFVWEVPTVMWQIY
jgi:hypothetical protein